MFVCDFPEEEGCYIYANLKLSLCRYRHVYDQKKVLFAAEVVGSAAMLGRQNLRGGDRNLLGII